MANYTIELYKVINDVLNGDLTELFPEYELFDNEHKQELEQKVVNHYYFNEIGFETYEMFEQRFKTKWLEIIPLANKYFQAVSDPKLLEFINDTRTRIYTLDKTGNSNSGEHETTTDNGVVFSDTPYTNYPASANYSTTKTDSSNTTTNKQTVGSIMSSLDKFDETVSGLNGMTYAEAMLKYKNAIFDVDMYIIGELRELFMEVF